MSQSAYLPVSLICICFALSLAPLSSHAQGQVQKFWNLNTTLPPSQKSTPPAQLRRKLPPLSRRTISPLRILTQGDYTYTTNAAGQATIKGFNKAYAGALSITNALGGCPVTSIADEAFSGCTNLTSVTIPAGVTFIGGGVFFGCGSLTSVTIPPEVTNIGKGAFAICPRLTAVTIPAGVTNIGNRAFTFCRSLKTVAIPAGVISIGSGPFSECADLTDITMDVANMFYTSVDGVLFDKKQTKLIQCPGGHKGDYKIPAGVTNIGEAAFSDCRRLTSVTIPAGVTSIDYQAFLGCYGLTSVTIPAGVTSIGESAFERCIRLTSVTIPASVTNIGSDAFNNCTSLSPETLSRIASLSSDQAYIRRLSRRAQDQALPPQPVARRLPLGLNRSVDSQTHYGLARNTSRPCVAGDYTYTANAAGQASIIGFHCERTNELVVADSLAGHSVVSIADGAFAHCGNLVRVSLPASVVNIGSLAFRSCERLSAYSVDPANPVYASTNGVLFDKSLTTLIRCPIGKAGEYVIPASVVRIGERAFYACTRLTRVSFPPSVADIRDGAFAYCRQITRLDLPESVTNIGAEAFSHCTGLTSAKIPACATNNVGRQAFAACTNLPLSIQSLGKASSKPGPTHVGRLRQPPVSPRQYLGKVVRSPALTQGDYSYTTNTAGQATITGFNKAYTGALSITNTLGGCPVTSISLRTFENFVGLTTVTIPDSATSIFAEALFRCHGLTNITVDAGNPAYASTNGVLFNKNFTTLVRYPAGKTGAYSIPVGVTAIRQQDFSGCKGLTSVSIPDSVTSIGRPVFESCFNLTTIAVDPANPSFSSLDGVLFDKQMTDLIRCPVAKTGNCTIPSSVTYIAAEAFSGCKGMTSVTIPAGVTSIGRSAFSGCTGLTSIKLPSGVKSIAIAAFSGCANLTSVTIPDSASFIGHSAFENCNGLTSVMIPSGVTYIGHSAFYGCNNLTSVTISAGVTEIGNSTFYGCNRLENITVDAGNPVFASSNGVLFDKNFTALVHYPAAKTGAYSIPTGVTSIDFGAFSGCTGLTSVTIPSGVTNINSWAFSDCLSLTNITVDADNPTYASSNGILFNKKFTALVHYPAAKTGAYSIPTGVTSIDVWTFSGCTGLTSVTIPSGVTNINSRAFSDCLRLTNITVDAGNPAYASSDGVLLDKKFTGLIHCPGGKIGTYSIPASVTNIGDWAFSRRTGLTNITVEVGNPAYASSNGILFDKKYTTLIRYTGDKTEAYSIPAGVTSISAFAFSGCSNLTSVTIPAGVTNIGKSAFANCVGLTTVTIPASVTKVEFDAFHSCTNLPPETLTRIDAFSPVPAELRRAIKLRIPVK